MDWNWFFSSIAQSSAAIVGLFGAFIITKIINNQNDFNLNFNRCNEYMAKSVKLKERADSLNFQWYNENKRKVEIDKILKEIKETGEILSPTDYYLKYNFSIYDNRELIFNDIKLETTNFQPEFQTYYISSIGKLMEAIIQERDEIDLLSNDITEHIYLIRKFTPHIELNPQSSRLITWSIIGVLAIFFIGVIIPLCFMPVKLDEQMSLTFQAFFRDLFSIKGFILSSVTLIFVIIMIVFIKINSDLKYPKKSIQNIFKQKDWDYYSTYFRNKEDNLKYIKIKSLEASLKE